MNQTCTYTTRTTKMLADTYTPVSIYLKLRDVYPEAVLLESNDYQAADNCFSYLCFDVLGRITLTGNKLSTYLTGQPPEVIFVNTALELFDAFQGFSNQFKETTGQNTIANGLFGHLGFETVNIFDGHPFRGDKSGLPILCFSFYRFVIAFDHFRDELILNENIPAGQGSKLADLLAVIKNKNVPQFPFHANDDETSPFTDQEYLDMVQKGIAHCYRGDVFQVVLSRRFSRTFTGDDMNLYRSLRSVNPSPYLFYFDYSNYRIFGSSPEAQLVVKNGVARINPIAGTFRRTGNDQEDKLLAARLSADEKENAEHIMLVDLARNDLSKNATDVEVKEYKQIHYYSHVIHLVSQVTGKLSGKFNPLELIANSFPAGTLSGAPKHKAIQLIQDYEKHPRGFYGGCIGFIGFNGDINTAIVIRSFLSTDNTLHYQAGAGIVAASVPQSELEEVNNKLRALRNALQAANNLNV